MNKALRKAVIAGNWKMNNTPAETTALLEEMKPLVADADCDVIICAPFVDLQAALDATKGSNIQVGAENCHWAEKGAFTAEVSAPMLKAMGVPYVIIGHSERRQYFGETNETVNKRVRAALDNGLKVILCVGEVLEEREQGVTFEVVGMQTKIALQGVSEEELKNVIIAYEPVWAIGTGKTATADQANEVNGYRSAVRPGCCRCFCGAVRRFYECRQRRRAAGEGACRRRTDRRRFFEGQGLLRDREGCF